MLAPASALTWQVWSRSRWLVLATGAYVLGLALAAHAPGAMEHRASLFLAAVPLAFIGLYLLAGFAFPEADLLAARSGYPRWMLVLPVETRRLAFWPMLHSALTAVLLWWLPVQLVLRPLGVPAPAVWPGVMIGALAAWLQALLWTPMGAPYLRVVLAVGATPLVVTLGIQAALAGTSEAMLTAAYGAFVAAAYGTAVAGLRLARRGEVLGADRPSIRRRSTERPVETGKAPPAPFASPTAAQFWFEWRCSGLVLPFLVLLICLLLTAPLCFMSGLAPIDPTASSALGRMEIHPWLRLQGGCLFFLPLLALIAGFGRHHEVGGSSRSLHPFLAMRPLRETEFIAVKVRAAAASTLLAWAVMLLFLLGWLLLPARDGDRTAPLLLLACRYCPPATAATLVLTVILLVFLTWRGQVVGLYADVSGRKWLTVGAPAAGCVLVVGGLVAWVQWYSGLQSPEAARLQLLGLLPWLIGAAVAGKVAAGGVILTMLRHRLNVAPKSAASSILAWLAALAVLTGALCWIAGAGATSSPLAGFAVGLYLPLCGQNVPPGLHAWPYLAAATALLLPFNRLALAPLLLAANRHRG